MEHVRSDAQNLVDPGLHIVVVVVEIASPQIGAVFVQPPEKMRFTPERIMPKIEQSGVLLSFGRIMVELTDIRGRRFPRAYSRRTVAEQRIAMQVRQSVCRTFTIIPIHEIPELYP
jgi:hypothetical protein